MKNNNQMTITKPMTLIISMLCISLFATVSFAADDTPAAIEKTVELSASEATEEKPLEDTKPNGLPLPLVTVYKSASCGCCAAWIDHMKDNGFPVEAHDSDNLNEYKIKAKLGAGLGSCHTAFVGDYAIEGHVPADDVKRLLTEKPDISGLTAPGMPMNSPGMAPKGSKPSGYDVISFKDGEAVGVFTEY